MELKPRAELQPDEWAGRQAPSLDDFEQLATAALESLPQPFRDLTRDVRCYVSEFAEADVLDELGIESEFDLMGLFTGVGMTEEGIAPTGRMPNTVYLYRRPILDYWAEHEDTLGTVVTHVLIHEMGHHFGFSDEDMEALEEQAAREAEQVSHTTQGTLLLDRLGIAYGLHPYDYDPDAPRVGLQAAEALGVEPSQLFKTLMAEVDGKPVCVIIPSDLEASMKKLAAAFAGKAAAMMKVPDAERLTGYKVGGIGPFGQKRKVPTALDETAELYDRIYLNAGQRGLLLSIAPADAVRAAEARIADLTSA